MRQLPSGLWQARLYTPDGRRPAVGTYEERTDAERALALAVADAIRGVQIDPGENTASRGQLWSMVAADDESERLRTGPADRLEHAAVVREL